MRNVYRGKICTFNQAATMQNLQQLAADELFANNELLTFIRDGAMIVENGIIVDIGEFHVLKKRITAEDNLVDYGERLITPGFIDTHLHAMQTSINGHSVKTEDVTKWLNDVVFPREMIFKSAISGQREYELLLSYLFQNGITAICAFLPSFYDGADVFFEMTNRYNMRVVMGNNMMTEGHEQLIISAKENILVSERLYDKWHKNGRASFALTPRFALSCNEELFDLCQGFMSDHPDSYFHTHLAESKNEANNTLSKFSWAKDNLAIYEKYDLVGNKSLFAHCIYLSPSEVLRLQERSAIWVSCPTSNCYTGVGMFNYAQALQQNVKLTLATDWGSGNTLSMFQVMDDAYKVGRLNSMYLSVLVRWFCTTLGAARALDLEQYIGSLEVGKEADFIVIDPSKNNCLLHRLESSYNLQDYLFNLISFGDDRIIAATYIMGEKVYGI